LDIVPGGARPGLQGSGRPWQTRCRGTDNKSLPIGLPMRQATKMGANGSQGVNLGLAVAHTANDPNAVALPKSRFDAADRIIFHAAGLERSSPGASRVGGQKPCRCGSDQRGTAQNPAEPTA